MFGASLTVPSACSVLSLDVGRKRIGLAPRSRLCCSRYIRCRRCVSLTPRSRFLFRAGFLLFLEFFFLSLLGLAGGLPVRQ